MNTPKISALVCSVHSAPTQADYNNQAKQPENVGKRLNLVHENIKWAQKIISKICFANMSNFGPCKIILDSHP